MLAYFIFALSLNCIMKKSLLFFALISTSCIVNSQQLGNGNMELWENVGQATEEPNNWNSFKSGQGGFVSFASQQIQRSTAIRAGATGQYCARVWSKSTLGIVANGNMTLGRINMGSSTPSNPANYNFSSTADANFSEALTTNPDSLVFWVKYTAAAGQQARVHAIIHDNYDLRDPIDANSTPHVVGTAELNYPPTGGTWVRKSIPFIYSGPATSTQFILVTFTTNMTPGGGANNDEILVDDIELIYNPVNQPVVAGDDNATTLQDVAIEVPVTTNDNDPENGLNCASITIVSGPSNGTVTINPANCSIIYTPSQGFFGSDSFIYSICDNGTPVNCDQALVSITVTEVVSGNNPIIANNDNAITDFNQPIIIDVIGNDIDAENQINLSSLSILSQPSNGTATVNNVTGEITYTPNNGFSGNDSFTYTICDNGTPVTCDTATVNVTVNLNVGLADNDNNNVKVSLNNHVLKIEGINDWNGHYLIVNGAGQKIQEGKTENIIPFHVVNGIYFIKINADSKETMIKLIQY